MRKMVGGVWKSRWEEAKVLLDELGEWGKCPRAFSDHVRRVLQSKSDGALSGPHLGHSIIVPQLFDLLEGREREVLNNKVLLDPPSNLRRRGGRDCLPFVLEDDCANCLVRQLDDDRRREGAILIVLLEVLQSVPILNEGFLLGDSLQLLVVLGGGEDRFKDFLICLLDDGGGSLVLQHGEAKDPH